MAFYAVGAAGMIVHVTMLWVTLATGADYRLATALAVETAIVHNFLWHERWTWWDRPAVDLHARFQRLLYFNLTTGVVSIVGNIAGVWTMVALMGWDARAASLLAIAVCSLGNFLASDRFVFVSSCPPHPTPLPRCAGERGSDP